MSYSFDQNYFQISQIFHLSYNPVSLVSSNLERKKENQQGQLGIRGGTGWPLNEVVRVPSMRRWHVSEDRKSPMSTAA